MPSTIELCEKYFGTKDIYGLLELTKDSPVKDYKKAYYKLSLKVHPDRVPEEEKEEATEKFKLLAKLYSILTDPEKKALYDEQGTINDDDEDSSLNSVINMWRQFFKPITTEDIDKFRDDYIDSELERSDIKKAYLGGKGCKNYMMNQVPFISVDDEPRLAIIVQEMIDAEEVPEYKIFTNEPKSKRTKRHQKYAREKVEADQIAKKLKTTSSLEQQIAMRNQARGSSFLDQLAAKYTNCDLDDEEPLTIDQLGKKYGQKKKAAAKKKSAEPEKVLHKTKGGRVSKRNK